MKSVLGKAGCRCSLPVSSQLSQQLTPYFIYKYEVTRAYAKGRDKPKEKG